MEMYTFRTRSFTLTDKYRAMHIILHFPLPKARALGFLTFFFPVLLFEGLIITSKLHINTCNFGPRELEPIPCLTNE